MPTLYPVDFGANLLLKAQTLNPGDLVACMPGRYIHACPNCGDLDGYMYAYKIGAPGERLPLHDFGLRHLTEASLISAPCPVCRGGQTERWLLENNGLKGLFVGEKSAPEIDLRNIAPRPFQRDAFAAALALMEEKPPRSSLYMFGPHGTGKTMVLAGLVARWTRGYKWALYITAERMLSSIKATFDSGTSQEAARARYTNVPVLAVDEFHRVQWTPWAEETIFSIMDERVMRQHPIYIASNKTPDDLALVSETGKAIVSRLSTGHVIPMVGEDLRPQEQGGMDL